MQLTSFFSLPQNPNLSFFSPKNYQSKSTNQMFPNMDLILLTLLYCSFISCALLLAIFVTFNGLMLAFFITLFSIVVIDVNDAFSLFSLYFVTVKANFELGFVVILWAVIHEAIVVMLVLKPLCERMVSEIKVKATQFIKIVEDTLLLIKTERY